MDHQKFPNSSVTNRFVPRPTRPQASLRTDVHVVYVATAVFTRVVSSRAYLPTLFIACSMKSPWENLSQIKPVYQRILPDVIRVINSPRRSESPPPVLQAIKAWERG